MGNSSDLGILKNVSGGYKALAGQDTRHIVPAGEKRKNRDLEDA